MTRMKTEEGNIVETQADLEITMNSFFSKLLEEPNWDWEDSQRKVFQHIPKVITEEHNLMLMKPIELEEVEVAVKQMTNDKAPRLDSFTTNLFHAH